MSGLAFVPIRIPWASRTPPHFVMSTRVSSAILDEAVKKLSAEWQTARSYWTDAKSREFERDYLEELPAIVAQARTAVEEIDVLLRKVRAACE